MSVSVRRVRYMAPEVAMSTPRGARPFRQLTTLQINLVAVLIAVGGLTLLYVGGRSDLWHDRRGLQAYL